MKQDLYEILDLPKDCSEDEIKKKYKKLAFVHHPDRGGNPEEFKKITEAYNFLLQADNTYYDDSNMKHAKISLDSRYTGNHRKCCSLAK